MQTSSLNKEKPLPKLAAKLPIKVVCVVRNLEDAKAEAVQAIRTFVMEEKLSFETRVYDSNKYRHDRDEISSLPAFHLYVKDQIQQTFYTYGRPYQIIDEHITAYLERQRVKWEKKHRWSAFWKRVRESLAAIGKRETRLERAERERREAGARRNSFDGRGHGISMADWN